MKIIFNNAIFLIKRKTVGISGYISCLSKELNNAENEIESNLKRINNQFIPLIKTRYSKYYEGMKCLGITNLV